MIKLLFDQGMPAGAVKLMRERGWDVVHVREIGMHESEDRTIFAVAAAENRAVVTLDKERLVKEFEADLRAGCILSFSGQGARLRQLPVRCDPR